MLSLMVTLSKAQDTSSNGSIQNNAPMTTSSGEEVGFEMGDVVYRNLNIGGVGNFLNLAGLFKVYHTGVYLGFAL